MIRLKKLAKLLAPALLALSFSTVAFAEISPQFVENQLQNPQINSEWPFPTECIATDVNLRTEPNTNCEVITMLQPGDLFYVKRVIYKSDYTWMEGTTADGKKGYMVSKYLDPVYNAAARIERFKAAFSTSENYNLKTLAAHFGEPIPRNYTKLDNEVFHYAPHRITLGQNYVHGESNQEFDVIGIQLVKNNYSFAGLRIGDSFNKEDARVWNKDMMFMGWEGPENVNTVDKYYWYKTEAVDGQERPVRGFAIFAPNNIITEIRWFHIPID